MPDRRCPTGSDVDRPRTQKTWRAPLSVEVVARRSRLVGDAAEHLDSIEEVSREVGVWAGELERWRIKELERELRRQEKAPAEAGALLALCRN